MLTQTTSSRTHGTFISQALPAAQQMGGVDVAVLSCTADVSTVRPGDVFFASDSDGDAQVTAQQAVDQGASAIVSERYLPVFGVPQYVVEDCGAAYSAMCHELLDHPTSDLAAIAIAGAYGKTSIAMLLESILSVAGKSVACQTNGYTRIDGQRSRFVLPTTAPAIAGFVDESLAAGCRHAVVELSGDTLRSQAASAAQFDVVCLANLYGDQASGDRSPQSIRDEMASALELLRPEGMAVLNADDQHSMRILAEYDGPAITFGIDHPAEVAGKLLESHVNEQTFLLAIGDETAAVRTAVVGQAHVQNCLAAAAIAKVYGVSLADIARGIESVKVVPGVMHRFDAGLGVATFVDRGHSPVARGAALSAAREVATGRVFAVVNRRCSVAEKLADQVICTAGAALESIVNDAVVDVLAALEVTDVDRIERIAEKLTGIALAVAAAEAGDVIVASGLGGDSSEPRPASESIGEELLVQTLLHELAARLPTRTAA